MAQSAAAASGARLTCRSRDGVLGEVWEEDSRVTARPLGSPSLRNRWPQARRGLPSSTPLTLRPSRLFAGAGAASTMAGTFFASEAFTTTAERAPTRPAGWGNT